MNDDAHDDAAAEPEVAHDAAAAEPEDAPDDAAAEPEDASRFAELVAARRAKLTALRDRGVDPYPVRFEPTHTVDAVRSTWHGLPAGTQTGERVRVAGRLVRRRGHGKLAFGDLREDGSDLQILCQVDVLGAEGMAAFEDLDVGDWVGVEGDVVVSKRGELSVAARAIVLLGKSLRPLPEKWHGLRDVERRFRER